jgi:hypothetical protein
VAAHLVRQRALSRFDQASVTSLKAFSSNPIATFDPLTRIGRLIKLGCLAINRIASVREGGFSLKLRSRKSSFLVFKNSL